MAKSEECLSYLEFLFAYSGRLTEELVTHQLVSIFQSILISVGLYKLHSNYVCGG